MTVDDAPVVVITEQDILTKAMFYARGYRTITPFDKTYGQDVDLVVFTGGADVNPEMYGEVRLDGTGIDRSRDGRDNAVFDFYDKVPKVGICRGSQYLNVKNGGKLWQHVNNHGRYHDLTNLLKIPGTPFDYDTKVHVSSTHHQMMIPPEHGTVIGIAAEATVFKGGVPRDNPEFDTEVVYFQDTNTLCCQFHPEYLPTQSDCQKYFFSLLETLVLKDVAPWR